CEAKVIGSELLRQQHGFIHGGALMTLADHTCGGAAASVVPEDREVITVENKVSFLRPASGPDLICRADVLRAGKTLVFVEAAITVGAKESQVLVAKASSTLAVIPVNAMAVPDGGGSGLRCGGEVPRSALGSSDW